MELLLQAGIHLIKKVITFVIYGRSVQVFKACTLFYFFPAEFFFSQIFLRGKVLSQEKSVKICEICGTFSTLRGYL